MSEGLNRAQLFGNLGSDPELKFTNNGTAVLNLRLATTTSFLDKNKERQERTEWHRVKVWGKRGEALEKLLSKGSKIYVEGEIRTSEYEKDGEKRWSTDIFANEIYLCDGKSDGGRRDDAREPTRGRDDRRSDDRGRQDDRRRDERGRDDRRSGRGREEPADDLPY